MYYIAQNKMSKILTQSTPDENSYTDNYYNSQYLTLGDCSSFLLSSNQTLSGAD